MSKIFGGSKSKQTSKSYNSNEALVNQKFGGAADATGTAINSMQQLLGGDASGFNAFKNATGFDALLQEGSRGITGNAAARGLLRSGSTGQALANYGNMMQNQYAQNYMQNLMGTGQLGLGAGGLLAQVGQKSESKQTSKKKPGLGGFLGRGIGMIAGGPAGMAIGGSIGGG